MYRASPSRERRVRCVRGAELGRLEKARIPSDGQLPGQASHERLRRHHEVLEADANHVWARRIPGDHVPIVLAELPQIA